MGREIDLRGRLREMAVGVREKLGLVEGLTKSSVLNPQLVDKGATFFPTPVCLVGGCEGGIQELGTRFKGFHMAVGFEHRRLHIKAEIGNSRVSPLAKGSLSFAVLLGTFALCESPSSLWGLSILLRGRIWSLIRLLDVRKGRDGDSTRNGHVRHGWWQTARRVVNRAKGKLGDMVEVGMDHRMGQLVIHQRRGIGDLAPLGGSTCRRRRRDRWRRIFQSEGVYRRRRVKDPIVLLLSLSGRRSCVLGWITNN
jgi:hypothetical protein